MTATYMDKSTSGATTLSSLDLRGVRYKSSGDQSDQDQSSGDQSDQDQSSGDQKDHDWFGGSPRSDSQKPDLPTDETESVFLPECLPHSDSVEFDISRVKDEVEEEDPLSSNLQVTFNTEASGLASIPNNQVLSNRNQQRNLDMVDGQAVCIGRIVPNVSGRTVSQDVLHTSSSADVSEGSPSRYIPEEVSFSKCLTVGDKQEENKIRRRKTEPDELDYSKNRPAKQRGGCRSTALAQTGNSAASHLCDIRDNNRKSNKSTSRVNMNKSLRKGVLLRTRSKSAGADSMSKRHGIAILSVNSVGCDVTSEVDNVDEVLAVDDDFDKKPNETPLFPPHTDGNDQSNKLLSPSPRKKRKPGKTAVKTLKKGRAGNFLMETLEVSGITLGGSLNETHTHPPVSTSAPMKSSALKQNYLCGTCGQQYSTKNGLRGHIRLAHSKNATYQCKICSKMFMSNHHYIGHMNKHYKLKPYKCSKCKSQYSYSAALSAHKKRCKNDEVSRERIQCEHCSQVFKSSKYLKDHLKSVHSPGLPYLCECGRRFKWRSSMKKHKDKACVATNS